MSKKNTKIIFENMYIFVWQADTDTLLLLLFTISWE